MSSTSTGTPSGKLATPNTSRLATLSGPNRSRSSSGRGVGHARLIPYVPLRRDRDPESHDAGHAVERSKDRHRRAVRERASASAARRRPCAVSTSKPRAEPADDEGHIDRASATCRSGTGGRPTARRPGTYAPNGVGASGSSIPSSRSRLSAPAALTEPPSGIASTCAQGGAVGGHGKARENLNVETGGRPVSRARPDSLPRAAELGRLLFERRARRTDGRRRR